MIPLNYFGHVFPLVKNSELWLKRSVKTKGQHGGDVITWEGSDYTEVYKEPFSSFLAYQAYGREVECQDRIFCPPNDGLFEGAGAYLTDRAGDPDYIVVEVIRWPEHFECLLKRR